MLLSKPKERCGYDECNRTVRWSIWTTTYPDTDIYTCVEHVGILLTDADQHYVYSVSESGNKDAGTAART